MGILFILLSGIAAILLIAKLASKVRPKEEVELEKQLIQKDIEAVADDASDEFEALASLLIRKEIISKEELLIEISEVIKHKEKH